MTNAKEVQITQFAPDVARWENEGGAPSQSKSKKAIRWVVPQIVIPALGGAVVIRGMVKAFLQRGAARTIVASGDATRGRQHAKEDLEPQVVLVAQAVGSMLDDPVPVSKSSQV